MVGFERRDEAVLERLGFVVDEEENTHDSYLWNQ